jgi:hypothetical protein
MRWLLTAALALAYACTPPRAAADGPPPRDAPAEARHSQGSGGMETLSDETLQGCKGDDAAVVLARVARAHISSPGTRSEAARVELEVERTICGTAPAALKAWRYTSGGNTVLEQGRRYVVAVHRGPGPVPYGLGDAVLVPEGREAEAVDAHLAKLRRAKP